MDFARTMLFLIRGLVITAVLAAACTLGGAAAETHSARAASSVEVVAELAGPAGTQDAVWRRIQTAIPEARIHWRYRVVLSGLALVLPADRVGRLKAVKGVKTVYRSVGYRASLDRSVPAVGAPALWGPALETAGSGIKIGIIDDGIDVHHPFFSGSGYAAPAGFPKGQTAYTSNKVIVARAFAPPSPAWRYAARPFDPQYSEHGTHVAGIAAGNYRTLAVGSRRLSGVAPKAYLGNYKVLTVPTPEVGINGNSPEIAAAIEAAVRDGMDVINLSIGEPEIEPSRDLVVRAINGAAAAGVVPVVAAGNEFEEFGDGSIISPGSAARAITVAASTDAREITTFSSAGPTPISYQMKPDLTAPGSGILSSVPVSDGTWDAFSGTSMATPHVSGGAALLIQRHPAWTVQQIKSALVQTGRPVDGRGGETTSIRQGGGFLNLPAADNPRLFANPTGLSFGLVNVAARGKTLSRAVTLTDAGGGAGAWSAAVRLRGSHRGVTLATAPAVTVPGPLTVQGAVVRSAPQQEVTGFVVLTQGAEQRRIPLWFRVTKPRLRRARAVRLRRPGIYRGNTRGKPNLVTSYRYPANPGGAELLNNLPGPEQVFRVSLRRPVANFGVVVLSKGGGVLVEPRVVRAGDENRLQGNPALPINNNPYLRAFDSRTPVVGAILPKPGLYDIVFDTPGRRYAGRFTFRFWIDDRTPPAARLLSRTIRLGRPVTLRISDRGAGVDPGSISATVDGRSTRARYFPRTGRAIVAGAQLSAGRHRLVLRVSDYQETKNMEDVPRILPNTRTLSTTFVVR